MFLAKGYVLLLNSGRASIILLSIFMLAMEEISLITFKTWPRPKFISRKLLTKLTLGGNRRLGFRTSTDRTSCSIDSVFFSLLI